ncbi:hypothetical protein D9M71_620460 [compost metagenome]
MEALADGIEAQSLAFLDRQAQADGLLQDLHLLADRARGNAQAFRRLGNTAAETHGLEDFQCTQGGKVAHERSRKKQGSRCL